MSITAIIIIAILASASAFALNQIMMMSQDIKYIKSHIKDVVKTPNTIEETLNEEPKKEDNTS